ncbi:hypothetical protein N825_34225 [Skermanella stibiiresistens SB22]|uniref:Uncharacterized protein n=1 Tax=Skermanella stibiiresistens SB22 TaxID=1385369 RepID=W9GPK2_9PROT|nr:hypothetical protein N825_34225 [Skermanella stibiiresistens SB22]
MVGCLATAPRLTVFPTIASTESLSRQQVVIVMSR